jgi:hypothetical protein
MALIHLCVVGISRREAGDVCDSKDKQINDGILDRKELLTGMTYCLNQEVATHK